MLTTLLLLGFLVLAAGAVITLLLPGEGPGANGSRGVALIAVLVAALCWGAVAAAVLTKSTAGLGPIVLWDPPIIKAALAIRVDLLSAFFLGIISVLAAAATWFSVGYTRNLHESMRGFYPPFLLFILGMGGVVVVDDFFFFLIPWEFMALASYALVVFHKRKEEDLAAGFKYFFITHLGTAALIFGLVLLATRGGSFRFDAMAAAMPGLLANSPAITNFALLLVFLGFLVKAGGFPFGLWWLPDAHPAAPSPVSALLSGVMIKLGLYGILRVFLGMIPVGNASLAWGLVLGAFGVMSLFFGTMGALVQHDSKRLLAYHSIGQVGYMVLGFGIGLAFMGVNPLVSALGLIGGLFHLFNHACFKGLLFLNAGSIEVATGERDLNNLGGLGRVLPITAACTLVACLAIAGLPLFNGFSSKWILYHASIWGAKGVGVIFLYFGIVAIFISAVTLASFMKFMGTTVWGTPSPVVRGLSPIREGAWLGAPQVLLAVFCVGFGVFPHAGARICYNAATSLGAARSMPDFTALFGPSLLSLQVMDKGAAVGLWSPIVVAAALLGAIILGAVIRRLGGAKTRVVPVWACGSDPTLEEMRFRAQGYYSPFKDFVHAIMPEWRSAWRPTRSEAPQRVLDLDGWLYGPAVRGVLAMFRWFARSHVGIPQVYAAWLVIGFVGSLLFLVLS